MNILMIAPYVTIEGRPEFERNKTGFGYMVMDIAKAVGKIDHVNFLATDTRGNGFEYEGVYFLKRSIITYLCSLFCCLPLGTLLSLRKSYSMSNGAFVRLVFYWLVTGCLHNLLKKEKYDMVHIHGCGFATELWMQVCKRCGQKYVVTLHGLNSFSDAVKLEPAGKKYERDFLKRVTDGELPITVISTGMKQLIEKTFGVCDVNNITVVCNSFTFGHTQSIGSSRNIREEYNIPQEAKILLYVGNISENKNQRQMVETYELLPEDIRYNTWVLFCGGGDLDNLQHSVNCLPLEDQKHLVFCGIVEKSEIPNYYKQADGVVLLSHAEGFGLSLVEGMYFGLPCVMFRDMDAFEDIYDERAVVAINKRDNESVAAAIEYLIKNDWNSDAIRDCSKKFESKAMAANYISVYIKL